MTQQLTSLGAAKAFVRFAAGARQHPDQWRECCRVKRRQHKRDRGHDSL